METTSHCYHSLFRYATVIPKNVLTRTTGLAATGMRDLTLIRVSEKIILTNTRLPVPKSFSVGSQQHMATNTNQPLLPDKMNKKVEEKDKEEEKKKLPPPPEKPEPGDCCGSGCVRCVWDVYYEELEEYNRLCKSISDSDPDGDHDISNSKHS